MRKFLLIISATFSIIAPFEVSAQSISLQECVSTAMENNFSVKISKNDLSIAQNNVTIAPLQSKHTLAKRYSEQKPQKGL
jgi:hypothetical protein